MTIRRKLFYLIEITVTEGQRALTFKNGKFFSILRPGRLTVATFGFDFTCEFFDLRRAKFDSDYADALRLERPDLLNKHFVEVRTGIQEVAAIKRDGNLFCLMKPEQTSLYWADAGPWDVEKFDISETLTLPENLSRRLSALGDDTLVRRAFVEQGKVGLLFVDSAFVRLLDPGAHCFWDVDRRVDVRQIDMRESVLDIRGQEILTKDRVSIRVNIAATYKVLDPVKALSSSNDFAEALYNVVQQGFRESLGTKTLDKILADKVAVDSEAAERIRGRTKALGIKVGDISLKDIVLPGEMREILNRVVEAEKEAEANVIRRREETNATRALLNTAKIMENNPAMMRLKELEALEKIADKVDSITVFNGTRGLLDDLVNLKRDS